MCVVGALSTYTAGLSSVNVSVIDTGRPQSEVQKGSRALEMGFRSSTRSTTFLFYFRQNTVGDEADVMSTVVPQL